jgi:hypothetical protein
LDDLSPLFSLSALEQLNVYGNDALTPESIDALKEKLPNAQINSRYELYAVDRQRRYS